MRNEENLWLDINDFFVGKLIFKSPYAVNKMAGHFVDFGLIPEICKSLEELNWDLPTDIQAESIPMILGGNDVLMSAETGTGKTGAFSIPVIQIVHEDLSPIKKHTPTAPKSARMSKTNRDPHLAVHEDGYLCQSRSSEWQGGKCELGVVSGKAYFQLTVTDEGLCRVGWSTSQASFNLGSDNFSFGFGGTGKKSHGNQFTNYGRNYGLNEVIGCYIDLDRMEIFFTINGEDLGTAFVIEPSLKGKSFFPSICLKNCECVLNFGQTKSRFPPKKEFPFMNNLSSKQMVVFTEVASQNSFNRQSAPLAIIVEPTRDLVLQVKEQMDLMSKHITENKPRMVVLMGVDDTDDQVKELNKGVDIVVGTLSKIIGFITAGKLSLSSLRFVVLDEADALLKTDFYTVNQLCQKCLTSNPTIKKVQFIVCSATLHNREVATLAEKYFPLACMIDLKGQDSVPDTVHHVVLRINPINDESWKSIHKVYENDGVHHSSTPSGSKDYNSLNVKYLKAFYAVKAIKKLSMDQAIIFCRTKLDCNNLENLFVVLGGGPTADSSHQFSCRCLHADRSQQERNDNLQAFKDKKVRILICTSVAARGIDIKGIPYLICLTLPDEKANYLHMIGRVGRADRMGLAINLVSEVSEKVWYHKCGKSTCKNTNVIENGGCCIWMNELQLLSDIEQHLMETIETIDSSLTIPVNEFDGVVKYGHKRLTNYDKNVYHTEELTPVMKELGFLEAQAEDIYLRKHILKNLS